MSHPRFELKNVKHSEFASHETNCFEAALYLDGKKIGIAHNEGFGGPTMVDYLTPDARKLVDEYVAALPEETVTLSGEPFSYKQSDESICDDLLTDWLYAKDMKKALRLRILFTKEGQPGIFQTGSAKKAEVLAKWLQDPEQIKQRLGAAKILNLLPQEEALTIYRAQAA